jgi:hypothetical protein
MDPTAVAGAGLFILAMGEVPNYYAGILPSWMTIRRFAADERDADTLRWGMAAASTFTLLVGAGASMLAHSWWPLVGTVTLAIFLCAGYEWAIRNPHEDATPINQQDVTGPRVLP